jgi:hypothetical protein
LLGCACDQIDAAWLHSSSAVTSSDITGLLQGACQVCALTHKCGFECCCAWGSNQQPAASLDPLFVRPLLSNLPRSAAHPLPACLRACLRAVSPARVLAGWLVQALRVLDVSKRPAVDDDLLNHLAAHPPRGLHTLDVSLTVSTC